MSSFAISPPPSFRDLGNRKSVVMSRFRKAIGPQSFGFGRPHTRSKVLGKIGGLAHPSQKGFGRIDSPGLVPPWNS
jgi:hypothetical protein